MRSSKPSPPRGRRRSRRRRTKRATATWSPDRCDIGFGLRPGQGRGRCRQSPAPCGRSPGRSRPQRERLRGTGGRCGWRRHGDAGRTRPGRQRRTGRGAPGARPGAARPSSSCRKPCALRSVPPAGHAVRQEATAGSATLRQLSNAADPLTRTFEARYVLEGALADAPLGATVTVQIHRSTFQCRRCRCRSARCSIPARGRACGSSMASRRRSPGARSQVASLGDDGARVAAISGRRPDRRAGRAPAARRRAGARGGEAEPARSDRQRRCPSESGFNLSALAVRERSITLFLIWLISVAGVVSFFKLGRAEDPAFTIKVMTVITAWPGATAQEMQDQVAEKTRKAACRNCAGTTAPRPTRGPAWRSRR